MKQKIIRILGVVGLLLIFFGKTLVQAEEVGQDSPPDKVNITIHKLMYDHDTELNVAINGIKNDGYIHDQYPNGVTSYNKADYGEVEFTIGNITEQVLPTEDSSLTNAKIDEIIQSVEANGAESEYIKKAHNLETIAVDEHGLVTFANRPGYVGTKSNVYVVYESKSAAGLVAQKAKPMVIVAPMTDRTGKSFLKDIHLYPKNIVQKLSFHLLKLGEDGTVQAHKEGLENIPFEVYKGDPGKGTKLGEITTDTEGNITVSDLTVGKYYLCEKASQKVVGDNPTEKQYLLGADSRNDSHNQLFFEITNEGAKTDLQGRYVNYKAPRITKKMRKNESSFSVGDIVQYQGTIHIPNDIAGDPEGIEMNGKKRTTAAYSVFKWGDTASQGLSFIATKAGLKVTNKDGSVVLKEHTDYHLETTETGFTLDFIVNNGQVSQTVAGLRGQEVLIDYGMVINQKAPIATPLKNTVDFIYSNDPYTKQEHHLLTETKAYTYGAKFVKVDSGLFGTGIQSTPLAHAKFVLLNKEGKYYVGRVDQDKDGVKEVNWTDDVSKAQILESDKNGKFEVTGFAKGEYQLKEVQAPDGYQKLTQNIKFTIDNQAYKEENRLVIKNKQKAVVPLTGREGRQTYVLITCVLLGIAAIGSMYYLKSAYSRD